MATSAIPAAIDYLVTQTKLLPEFAAPVVVSDGWASTRSGDGIAIGITPEDGETESTPAHAALGAQMEYEEFAIPCIIWAWRSGNNAQKTARDAAFVLWNALTTKIRADRTLGGALKSGAAIATDLQVHQTNDADEAGEGRACEIRFVVRCKNRF